jgi:hypothetical protein
VVNIAHHPLGDVLGLENIECVDVLNRFVLKRDLEEWLAGAGALLLDEIASGTNVADASTTPPRLTTPRTVGTRLVGNPRLENDLDRFLSPVQGLASYWRNLPARYTLCETTECLVLGQQPTAPTAAY